LGRAVLRAVPTCRLTDDRSEGSRRAADREWPHWRAIASRCHNNASHRRGDDVGGKSSENELGLALKAGQRRGGSVEDRSPVKSGTIPPPLRPLAEGMV
jgi:hypothetical protein